MCELDLDRFKVGLGLTENDMLKNANHLGFWELYPQIHVWAKYPQDPLGYAR